MKKDIAQKVLNETEAGYDLICIKFSQTRKHFWRSLEFIADHVKKGDSVLDFGCGNGRLLELFEEKNVQYWGVDVSGGLIDLAKSKHPEQNISFSKIDPKKKTLAFEERFFNTVYSIAVFHHFPSKEYRQAVANDLFRVTKDGGKVVITAWYLWPVFFADWRIWQVKQKKYFKNILQNWKSKIKGESLLDWNDCEIDFTDNQGKKFARFHHAFTRRELKRLFQKAGYEIERCEIVENKNILLIGKKTKKT
ncbi:MAG: methyltransferase domain-containing protein [bacterium]